MQPYLIICGGRDDNRTYSQVRLIKDPFKCGDGLTLTQYEKENRPLSVELSDNVEVLPSMSCPRNKMATACLSDHEFVVTGGEDGKTSLRSCEIYDMRTKQWTNLPNMHFSKKKHSIVCLEDGKIITIGGENDTSILRNVESYDPKTKNWKSICPLAYPRHSFSCINVSNKIYVFGGRENINDHGRVYKSAECIDLSEKNPKWVELPNMKSSRSNAGCVYINNYIHVIGGTSGVKVLETTEIFDIKNNKWIDGPVLNTPRIDPSIFLYYNEKNNCTNELENKENCIIVFGGFCPLTKRAIDTIEVLNIEKDNNFKNLKYSLLDNCNTGLLDRRAYNSFVMKKYNYQDCLVKTEIECKLNTRVITDFEQPKKNKILTDININDSTKLNTSSTVSVSNDNNRYIRIDNDDDIFEEYNVENNNQNFQYYNGYDKKQDDLNPIPGIDPMLWFESD